MTLIDTLLQYGIAGAALYMMYRLYDNHLKTIEDKLDQIIELLARP